MNISQRIDEIIVHRKKQLPQINQMQQQLEQVQDTIEELDNVCKEIVSGESAIYSALIKMYPEVTENLRMINMNRFYESYKQTQLLLSELARRFSREQVHISFVGRAGRGKSLVMQNISGLSGDVIPSSDGTDCTGAKSIITNQQVDEVKAEITFYNQTEYVGIINKYLMEIFEDTQYMIHSISEIAGLNKKNLQSQVDSTSANKQSLYLQLEKYIQHSEHVIPLLGTVKTVPASEIESYVAQYSHEDKNKKFYTYLGVKVANIICRFPYTQSGKIVLVDTIGLGATALDIREQMLETVSKDSDAIILMTKPEAQRPRLEQDDIDIVTDISERMSDAYVRNMMFWVLNKVSEGVGRNVEGIPGVLNQLERMHDFPTAGFLVVDCKDKTSVENELLIPVLKQLSNNIPQIDEMLIKKAQEQISLLYEEYHAIAEKVGKAFLASVDQDMRREFHQRIKETYKAMTNTLRELYINAPYGALRNQPCEKLKVAAEERLLNILRQIPDKEDVLALLNDGSINQHNAYEILTDKMRLCIINDFLELNSSLRELVNEMKAHIVYCLADENQGRLKYLISVSPEKTDEWLNELVALTEQKQCYRLLTEALKKLVDFDLRMESFLIYRVRAHLDAIDISLETQPPQLKGSLAEKEKLANDIIFWFEHNLEIIYKEIRDELEQLYEYPNNTLWAVVKDFYDRIVYAHDNQMDVEECWRYLYEDSISYIWHKECDAYQMQKGISEQWNTLMYKIQRFDNKDAFKF